MGSKDTGLACCDPISAPLHRQVGAAMDISQTMSWPAAFCRHLAGAAESWDQGRTGPFLVAGLPCYKGELGQPLAGLLLADVCQTCSKCWGFPVTASSHAGGAARALGAQPGLSHPGWDSALSQQALTQAERFLPSRANASVNF